MAWLTADGAGPGEAGGTARQGEAFPGAVAPPAGGPGAAVLRFSEVDVDRVQLPVLRAVTWEVGPGERWAVLGPNGSGKTTVLQLASGYLHPSRGTVDVLGHRLGRVDVRELRLRIGLVSAAVAKVIVPSLSAVDVVMSARHAAFEPWWHSYDDDDRDRALALLEAVGFAGVANRPFGVLSEGERQHVLLARTLVTSPDLLLLDEPCAGLDVGGRERLVGRLGTLAADPAAPPMVLVTHHVEEIPLGFTHVLLLAGGVVVTAGPLAATLTAEHLSACFGLSLSLGTDRGRWTCRAE